MRGAYSSKRNFLFDLDGTLVDSSAAHTRAFVDALSLKWPTLARDFNYGPFAGCPTREVFLALGLPDEAELIELIRHKQQYYRDAFERGDVRTYPGAPTLLERLLENGNRLFLVTGASRLSTRRVLETTGLERFFEGVVTSDDVRSGKPSPEPYLHTLASHGLEKRDCLVIEDGENGIIAAQKAGLEAVLIHTDLQLPGVPNVRDCATFAALMFP